MARNSPPSCCPPKPALAGRPLMSDPQASELEATFKMLANGTRLRMLHALVRAGELCVSDLADALEMKPQAVSNQLQRLADRGIVGFRRQGLQIYYRMVDPCVVSILDFGWCLAEDAKSRAAEGAEAERVLS